MSNKFLIKVFTNWFNSNKVKTTNFGNDCEKVWISYNKCVRKSFINNCYEINTYVKEWEKEFKILPIGSVGFLSKGVFNINSEVRDLIIKVNNFRRNGTVIDSI